MSLHRVPHISRIASWNWGYVWSCYLSVSLSSFNFLLLMIIHGNFHDCVELKFHISQRDCLCNINISENECIKFRSFGWLNAGTEYSSGFYFILWRNVALCSNSAVVPLVILHQDLIFSKLVSGLHMKARFSLEAFLWFCYLPTLSNFLFTNYNLYFFQLFLLLSVYKYKEPFFSFFFAQVDFCFIEGSLRRLSSVSIFYSFELHNPLLWFWEVLRIIY